MDNSIPKRKISIFKLLLIITDIIVLIGFIITFVVWNKNHMEEKNNYQKFEYKNFTFNIPNDIKYSVIDEKKFKLESDNYEAIIETYLDKNQDMFKYRDKYYQILLNNGLNVDKSNEIVIGETPVLVYQKYDTRNSVLCYFNDSSPFAHEVEIFNNDNSFSTDYLESIMYILMSADYDYDSDEKYVYYDAKYIND